jgi:glycosyltransferase involved in cell wall biosynthesis
VRPRALVVIDADVLGRKRTGDETHVENLLRFLPPFAEGLRLAAVTRHPELVPSGVTAIDLPARFQELRMAVTLPRLLLRLRPALVHFQHALPPVCPCPALVTVHDLSFERDPSLMPLKDRLIFRTVVPRSARRAARVFAVSERTREDLIELYGIPSERIVVTPNGVDPAFTANSGGGLSAQRTSGGGPGEPGGSPGAHDSYLLFVGAIQERKNPLAAADAAREVGLPLVVAGPEKEPSLARELERRGARLRGYVGKPELADLYRGAACLVLPSRYEGFGLPMLEAMASGTPVVAAPEPALVEVGGDAALFAEPHELVPAIRRALHERARLRAAGLERARAFSWEETARRTAAVYREVLEI